MTVNGAGPGGLGRRCSRAAAAATLVVVGYVAWGSFTGFASRVGPSALVADRNGISEMATGHPPGSTPSYTAGGDGSPVGGRYAPAGRLCTRTVPRVVIVPRKGGFGVLPSHTRVIVPCALDYADGPANAEQLPQR